MKVESDKVKRVMVKKASVTGKTPETVNRHTVISPHPDKKRGEEGGNRFVLVFSKNNVFFFF